jgi:hypothetical protein
MPSFEPALEMAPGSFATVDEVVKSAVKMRVRASQDRAEKQLRRLGIRARPVERRRAVSAVVATEEPPKAT